MPFALSLLENEKLLSPAGLKSIETIRRNIEMESRLLGDLLDVSRIVHGKMDLSFAPSDIHQCVRQALEIVNPAFAAKELNLTVMLEAGRHQVFGDIARLQQIFWNLFQNAAKFSRVGGSVKVRSYNPTEDRVVVEVTDIGIGIKPGVLPKVFDAFERGDTAPMQQYGGLGLGLTICQAIVKAHLGSITAESTGGDQGATLIVDLPTMLDDAESGCAEGATG